MLKLATYICYAYIVTGLILIITFKMARLKFGDSLVIRQTAKLKSPPNKPRIRYIIMGDFQKLQFFANFDSNLLNITYKLFTTVSTANTIGRHSYRVMQV